MKYTCSMEKVQKNGRFTLFSNKLPSNIYSILFGYAPYWQTRTERGTSIRKTIMDYGQTKYSRVLPGTIYYLGLHRPMIKELYSGQIWLVDELQKTAVDCIVNMTKPGTNRN